ncbi:MAG TPA: hypothetical protein VFW46_15650 [Stellaceae bacterium]|nr:hypothetical protein [Stellaceae bacterium]
MIDLKPFCSNESWRPYLHKPFADGEWVYATNGHICVRVPRNTHDAVPEKNAPDAKRLFDIAGCGQELVDLPKIDLPETIFSPCSECHGRGTEHDCPDCECACESCGGTGDTISEISVSLAGAVFLARYIKLMQALPAPVKIEANRLDHNKPLFFVFEGGQGLLMPTWEKYPHHIELAP